jgi:hypothetical protein
MRSLLTYSSIGPLPTALARGRGAAENLRIVSNQNVGPLAIDLEVGSLSVTTMQRLPRLVIDWLGPMAWIQRDRLGVSAAAISTTSPR